MHKTSHPALVGTMKTSFSTLRAEGSFTGSKLKFGNVDHSLGEAHSRHSYVSPHF
jgi:hypothetical protein